MKIKRYILSMLLVFITIIFSGCANITYTIKLKENEKADVNVSVLYNNPEYNYNVEKIEEVKQKFIDEGYKVQEISDKGLKGFAVTKENINIAKKIKDVEHEYKIDIMKDVCSGIKYNKKFLSNEYNIDGIVDLTSYSYLKGLVSEGEEVISDDDYNKLLSEMNLKLVVELDKGYIVETNSTLISDDNKSAEWVLIPGTKTEVEFKGTTTEKLAAVGTVVIFSVVIFIALMLFVILGKMYFKKNKNND